MDKELREELVNIIKNGSNRALKKIKKETMIDLINSLWDEEKEIKEKLERELINAEESKRTCDEIIESHKRMDQTLDEYQKLLSEIKEKHSKELTKNLKFSQVINKLVNREKSLVWTICGLIGLEIITIILGIIL